MSGGGSSSHKTKSILDPKNFVITVFDGDKGDKENLEEWREDIEDFLDTNYSKVKAVLEK